MNENQQHQNFVEIYHKHHHLVRRVLFQMQGPDGLDDLVQDVFFKIWKNLKSFQGQSQVKTWVYRISVNSAIDQLRRKKIQTQELKEHLLSTPEEEKFEASQQKRIQKALADLASEQRSIVILYYYEEQSLEEISAILDVPVGTVKSRLFYARKQLLTILQNQEVDDE